MALPVSNSVGSVQFSTDLLLGHAVRRCGVASAAVPEETAEALTRIAYAWLSNLSNRGVPLWTIDKVVLGIIPNMTRYPLPVGVVDVHNVLSRTLTLTPSTASGVIASASLTTAQKLFARDMSAVQMGLTNWIAFSDAWVGYDFGVGAAVAPTTVAWIGTDGRWVSFTVQYSDNGTTWTNWHKIPGDKVPGNPDQYTQTYSNQWTVRDIPQTVAGHRYWRLIAPPADLVALRQVQFGFSPVEVQMGRLNRTEYSQQSVQRTPASRGVPNYWFDRTMDRGTIVLWPAPSYGFDQITVWHSRHIMDPGDLLQQLEVPQRWWLAVMAGLAEQVFHELPSTLVDLKRYPLIKGEADKRLAEAEAGEDDSGPLYLVPPIAAYTR